MKTLCAVCVLALTFFAGAVVSAQVRDWHDLDKVHQHVVEAINELDRAREANHFDMEGHGAKAKNTFMPRSASLVSPSSRHGDTESTSLLQLGRAASRSDSAAWATWRFDGAGLT
jgi:hypothetical protein